MRDSINASDNSGLGNKQKHLLQIIPINMKNKFPYRYRILIMLFFLILITYLDRICISLVGVRIKSEFNLNNEKFGWVLAAFSLAYALCEIPAGALGDRI